MKKYPAYKDSGVEWIDQIPNHWLIIPFRRVIEFLTDFEANGSFSSLSKNVVDDFDNKFAWFVRATDLENKSYLTFQECRYINEDSYQYLSKTKLFGEELLIAKRGEIGKLYQMPKLGIKASLAPNLYLLRLSKEKMSSSFAYYYFISDVGHSHLSASNKSTTIGALYKDDCKKLEIIYPPLSDQYNICAYLDYKTQQIDDLIIKKQKLIDLLKEERTALINRAVSKGLDPTVRMKDSGIDWLSKVPEHWKVKRIKHLSTLKSGESITSESIGSKGEYPVFGGNGIRGYYSSYTHDGNYVLIGRQGALCGNINYAFGKFWASEHAVVASLGEETNIIWFGELLKSMNLNSYSQSAAQPGLAVEMIKNLRIPIPPIEEQNAIGTFIQTNMMRIEKLTFLSNQEIALINEYKTSLINEAVTGKIDVRDYNITNA
jgi:type I restriction enzyme, S subunit